MSAFDDVNQYNNYSTWNQDYGKVTSENKNKKRQNIDGYLSSLQKNFPGLSLSSGNSIQTKSNGKPNNVILNTKLLERMSENNEVAKEYEQRLKDIERSMKWADSVAASMGNRCVYRCAYVDENGQMTGFSIIRSKDGLNERLREEAKKNREEFIQRHMEKSREEFEKYASYSFDAQV